MDNEHGTYRPTACAECSKAHEACSERRFKCKRCETKNLACSNTKAPIRLFATDFYFKHEPADPLDYEWTEHEPFHVEETLMKDRNIKQYYYVEPPYSLEQPWSPLYLRKYLEAMDVAPFALTPSYNDDGTQFVDAEDTLHILRECWRQHNQVPFRCFFFEDEKVMTCRRICTLFAYLECGTAPMWPQPSTPLDSAIPQPPPPPDCAVPRSLVPYGFLAPGHYKVRWRFQFFNNAPAGYESNIIAQRHARIPGRVETHSAQICNHAGCTNPFGFPCWTLRSPGWATGTILKLSVGFKQYAWPIAPRNLQYGITKSSDLANQILLAEPAPFSRPADYHSPMVWMRKTCLIGLQLYHTMCDEGWCQFQFPGLLQVNQRQDPCFVIENIDTGGWQGGFRFGGVELIKVDQVNGQWMEPAMDAHTVELTDVVASHG